LSDRFVPRSALSYRYKLTCQLVLVKLAHPAKARPVTKNKRTCARLQSSWTVRLIFPCVRQPEGQVSNELRAGTHPGADAVDLRSVVWSDEKGVQKYAKSRRYRPEGKPSAPRETRAFPLTMTYMDVGYPDRTPFWSYFRIAGHSFGTRSVPGLSARESCLG
jgi:hypothetical protein